jgi:hypothetical protein
MTWGRLKAKAETIEELTRLKRELRDLEETSTIPDDHKAAMRAHLQRKIAKLEAVIGD